MSGCARLVSSRASSALSLLLDVQQKSLESISTTHHTSSPTLMKRRRKKHLMCLRRPLRKEKMFEGKNQGEEDKINAEV